MTMILWKRKQRDRQPSVSGRASVQTQAASLRHLGSQPPPTLPLTQAPRKEA